MTLQELFIAKYNTAKPPALRLMIVAEHCILIISLKSLFLNVIFQTALQFMVVVELLASIADPPSQAIPFQIILLLGVLVGEFIAKAAAPPSRAIPLQIILL